MSLVAAVRSEYQRYRRTAELAMEQVDDGPFEAPTLDRPARMRSWAEAFDVVEVALAAVEAAGAGVLTRGVTIRQQPLTVLDALLRSVAHVAYHTGQIVLLARSQVGPRWRTISIPRGGSQAYAANPTREMSPDGL